MKTFEIRYRVPWTDAEQSVYGFIFKVRKAESIEAARTLVPTNAFDIHVTQVPA